MDRLSRAKTTHNELEALSGQERFARLFAAVKELLAVAGEKSSEFATRLEAAGLGLEAITDYAAFTRIPPLRKKDLIGLQRRGDRLGGLLACEIGRLRRIYQSPGPIYDPEGAGPDYWGWAEAFHAAGFAPGDLVQMTFGYHLTPAGLMLEEPLRELGCAVIPAGPGNTEVQIELMRDLPVTGFVGMASYLKTIGEKARAKGLDPRRDFSLEVAFVAAERLSETLRREVEEMFGVVVRQGYGTADVGAIAYECPALCGMHVSSRGLLEICTPGTGEPLPPGEIGEVVFTPLSPVYPLIRLATGDLSRIAEAPCPCGRLSPRLTGILGRVDDTAKVKGQFIYPAQAAEVAARFPAVAGWQLVVENPGGKDSLSLRLKLSGPLDEAAFAAAFQDRLKLRPKILKLAPGEDFEAGAPRLVDKRSFD